jgi:hypothetical protein
MQHKRLREQPFRKVENRRRMVAASVFGSGVATLRAVPLMRGLERACVRGAPMLFAMKFCHRWRAADFAFAFARHFYLPSALPRHSRIAFPILRFAAFLLLSDPAAEETKAVPATIDPFDFQRLNIDFRKIQPVVTIPPHSSKIKAASVAMRCGRASRRTASAH